MSYDDGFLLILKDYRDESGETMRKLKLVAMDVDGTLMGKNKILTKRTKDTLTEAAAKGIHLVVASRSGIAGRAGRIDSDSGNGVCHYLKWQ